MQKVRGSNPLSYYPVQVYVVPGELAQLARAQAESDRQHEKRLAFGRLDWLAGFRRIDVMIVGAVSRCPHGL
jgi:hypothetical protein